MPSMSTSFTHCLDNGEVGQNAGLLSVLFSLLLGNFLYYATFPLELFLYCSLYIKLHLESVFQFSVFG